jgi:hypothetical protein
MLRVGVGMFDRAEFVLFVRDISITATAVLGVAIVLSALN